MFYIKLNIYHTYGLIYYHNIPMDMLKSIQLNINRVGDSNAIEDL